MGISDEDRKRIIAWARKHPEIQAVYLTEAVRGGDNKTHESNIDLAVQMFPTEDKDSYNVWRWWNERYLANPDLHLEHPVQVEWYEEGVVLERVGVGVKRDGVLLYRAVATG